MARNRSYTGSTHATLGILIVLVLFAGTPFGAVQLVGWFSKLKLEQSFVGKLKQTADVNTIELAKKKLTECVTYLDENKMTSGSTHIFFATPENDLTFYHDNLTSALKDLENFPKFEGEEKDRSNYNLAMSNQLIKLRETILDADAHVTCPENLALYPNQVIWMTCEVLSVLWILAIFAFGALKYDWN